MRPPGKTQWLGEGARRFLQETGSIAMPKTFALLAPFAIAVAAFILSLGFFLGTSWAAIHSESTLRSVDDDRAGQPLRARDLHIDRFEYVPDGRRLLGFTVKPIAGAD
jgi:hypothetical protein